MNISYKNPFLKIKYDGSILIYEAKWILKIFARLIGANHYLEIPLNSVMHCECKSRLPLKSIHLYVFKSTCNRQKLKSILRRKIIGLPKRVIHSLEIEILANIHQNLSGQNVMLLQVPQEQVDEYYLNLFRTQGFTDEKLAVNTFEKLQNLSLIMKTPMLSADGR